MLHNAPFESSREADISSSAIAAFMSGVQPRTSAEILKKSDSQKMSLTN
jgi:hypothetical protein